MKSLLAILFIAFVVISCSEDKRIKTDEQFDVKVRSEIESGVRHDTIFLGYWFGMTKEQFMSKTKNMLENKKLYRNKDGVIEYEMTLDGNLIKKGKALFEPKYYQNRLYELTVGVQELNSNRGESAVQLELFMMLMTKYGAPDYSPEGYITGSTNYFWISGNRQIKLAQGFYDARIFYTDVVVEEAAEKERRMKEAAEKEAHKEQAKQTTLDL